MDRVEGRLPPGAVPVVVEGGEPLDGRPRGLRPEGGTGETFYQYTMTFEKMGEAGEVV